MRPATAPSVRLARNGEATAGERLAMRRDSISIGVIGAGLSGILMGIRLRKAGIENFTIYEKADEAGGTWRQNTYPGLHCDVPSHLYCYSFEPNPDWSQLYASQPEIKAYFQRCAEKYGLSRHLRFNVSIEQARYRQDDRSWTLTTSDGRTFRHDVLVAATGGLTAPNLPKIGGFDVFRGRWWHSGAWDHDCDLADKRVAVVGSAASAVQVVPHVVERARQVFVLQRTPNWVYPRKNFVYREDAKVAFRDEATGAALRHRRVLYRRSLRLYKVFQKDPAAQAWLRGVVMDNMKAHIHAPDLIERLTPSYTPGCKRILISDDFYPALAKDHVELIPAGIGRLSETGVVATDGRAIAVDIVIFCTGYKLGGRTDGKPAMNVVGRDGRNLRDTLSARPEAYYGIAIPGFPNYFTICGINGTVAYASLAGSAEVHADYIVERIRDLSAHDLRVIEVKPDIVRRFNDAIQTELQGMSWADDCPSFYRDPAGRIVTFYPGTLARMRRELRAVGLADYDAETA